MIAEAFWDRIVSITYFEQIRALLYDRAKHSVGFDEIATLIGSCLLIDAYPNACHGKDYCLGMIRIALC
jgi:hypothetical protein